jgi:rod shape-determining protein MreC
MVGYRRANRRYVLVLLVLTAITLITLDTRRDEPGVLGAVGRAAHAIVSPIERAVNAVASPVADWFDGVTEGSALKRENRELRTDLERMQNRDRDARTALEENETLRRLLDLPVLSDVQTVTAKVVNRSPSNFEWTVTIDKGEESGISPDMPVMGPAGLVGRVLESWGGGAKILLLVDPDSNVGVRVQPGLVSGIAEGVAGSARLRLDLDANAQVDVGDDVVTSGLENSSFPEGLGVGRVVETEQQPGGLGTIVRVDPWTDFDALTFVTVLRWVPGQGPVVSTTTTTTSTTTTPAPETTVAPDTTGASEGVDD